jgi:hypothetical protein
VLINDTLNGGLQSYRRVTTPLRTGINMVSPLPGASGILPDTRIFASIIEGATTVDLNSVRLRLDGNLVTAPPTRNGSLITVSHQPASVLSSAQHTAALSYTAGGTSRTQAWTFRVAAPVGFSLSVQRTGADIDLVWTEPGTILQESTDLATWADLTSAASPYRISGDTRRMVFYRLRR